MLFKAELESGILRGAVAQARLSGSRLNIEELASIRYIDLNAVKTILDAIDAYPDWDGGQRKRGFRLTAARTGNPAETEKRKFPAFRRDLRVI